MAKINPNFQHDAFRMLHQPLRVLDAIEGRNFLERFLIGAQTIFEDTQDRIKTIPELFDPAKTPRPDLLKDHVGFTKELNNITNDLSENDLRKLISLAVALWKQKGVDPGYANIVRLFTGKSARIFNWFDFRMIVGEKAFGEEQLGEDSWLISVPGVEFSEDPVNTVVDLITFEDNVKDRSLVKNHGTVHGDMTFFMTPNSGFPQGSKKFARFGGGVMVQTLSDAYDLSADVTVEAFFRTTDVQASRTLIALQDGAAKGLRVDIDTVANTVSFRLSDGTNVVTGSLTPGVTLTDGVLRHIALTVKRGTGARLWLNGTEATGLIALGALGDMTNAGGVVLAGRGPGLNVFLGDMDNFRACLNAVYDPAVATLLVPITGFIEYIEEQLDEYFTDIRIVDEGDLNKTLILRILNLMRPSSERLNVIFIRFFDDFLDGIGNFDIIAGTGQGNTETQLELNPNSIAATSVLNDEEFKDIILQVKCNDKDPTGGIFSVLVFVQDALNYYEFRADTVNKVMSLWKYVAGVPTQIGADVAVDIVPQASYVLTVATSWNDLTNESHIQTYLDSNRLHIVDDGAFEKGKFGLKTGAATTLQVDEIEMMQLPVDVQVIEPNFNL